jgi:hypothetical protein
VKKRNQDVFEIEFEMAFYTHTHVEKENGFAGYYQS